jgi:hypothetical protein
MTVSERHELEGCAVFLSASFPSGERGQRVAPYDPAAIADAVSAIARAVLYAGGRLVFGGHPTISPLVLLCAADLDVKHRVDIFQSRFFEDAVPPETLALDERGYGVITWTPSVANDRQASLDSMRDEMLTRDDLVAGVFIGGMEGVTDEAAAFAERHPGAWLVPVLAPGGAARAVRPRCEAAADLNKVLASERYPLLAWRLVEELAKRGHGMR